MSSPDFSQVIAAALRGEPVVPSDPNVSCEVFDDVFQVTCGEKGRHHVRHSFHDDNEQGGITFLWNAKPDDYPEPEAIPLPAAESPSEDDDDWDLWAGYYGAAV